MIKITRYRSFDVTELELHPTPSKVKKKIYISFFQENFLKYMYNLVEKSSQNRNQISKNVEKVRKVILSNQDILNNNKKITYLRHQLTSFSLFSY